MLTQIKNARFYLQAKLGQRGAEMVEYAIVLACIAAVAAIVYGTTGTGTNSLKGVLEKLWGNVADSAKTAKPES
ncbi:hypothetical protein [uncultured Phascolarctobacterium sp.]|uniref:hypothetical protein n=1 Tax=uncultured Phascolarctobacterium sp. TaxID=512296 RepID=UPI0025DD1207|nr:hypothetical protein [uncultured Phascolarctobacterium sp.]